MNNVTVFRNVHRKPKENTPHYRGYADINGQKYDIALWINDDIQGVPIHMTGQAIPGEDDGT